METYLARQPIFDANQKVFGYELFFRSGMENAFRNPDPNQATSKVRGSLEKPIVSQEQEITPFSLYLDHVKWDRTCTGSPSNP